ncbi:hypothetical protein JAAARDRAFT_192279 [Jaapia argillacea MUCL 33604]|uniref:Uncharacterized protein n=1 Tax=Jaapia argillacea MUCL 33604 TaxID=933084 RepID=A0A067QB68_9AGAM|nr:hypothetical protein JAAARDRAFT_192279 [Jaapia argillacea MUCL 33604]
MSTTTTSAYIVGNALLTFPKGFSKQSQDDVMNLIIFSELVANKQYDKLAQLSKWYGSFLATLEQIGWVNDSSITFIYTFTLTSNNNIDFNSSPTISDSRFNPIPIGQFTLVDNLVIATLQISLSGPEVSSVKDVIQALQSGNDVQAKLFNGQATDRGSGQQANFGIRSCQMGDGNPTCLLNAFDLTFSKSTSSSGVLFQGLSQSDTGSGGYVNMRLNADIYNTICDTVLQKLGGSRAGGLVQEITLW